jgi:hypothetical protein
MHDDSPGGQAIKDRTLAYWTDQNNFDPTHKAKVEAAKKRKYMATGFMFAMLFASNTGLF